jgi:anti-sigma factor RsiW
MTGIEGGPAERALWGRAAATMSPPVPGAVSDADLAGWLDGRLSIGDAARVEAALAADPALLQAALDIAAARGAPLPAVPERLLVRARALVAPPVVGTAGSRSGLARLFVWRQGLQWAAVATLSLAVGLGGFTLGGRTHTALAGQRHSGSSFIAIIDSLGGGDLELGDAGSDP